MDADVWRRLVEQLAQTLARDDVAGVVITHGSDTLEDTAWLLQCLFGDGKPVVLTCAMRPADHAAPDGPGNLLDALAVVRDAGAVGCGVLAVCAGRVHAARHLRKCHGWALDAFTSDGWGAVGAVANGQVRWLQPVPLARVDPAADTAPPGWRAALSLCGGERQAVLDAWQARGWPWVEILTSAACADGRAVTALIHAGVKGLVIAGTGSGTVHRAWLAAAASVRVPVVLGAGCDMAGMPLTEQALWSAADLSPRKARIALALFLLLEDFEGR
jgi:L-asparaginase